MQEAGTSQPRLPWEGHPEDRSLLSLISKSALYCTGWDQKPLQASLLENFPLNVFKIFILYLAIAFYLFCFREGYVNSELFALLTIISTFSELKIL